MLGLAAGATVAFAVIVAADQVAGTGRALPFALLVCAGAVVLSIFDPDRR